MKITRVCCQGCGADLEVDDSVRYTDEMADRITQLELQSEG